MSKCYAQNRTQEETKTSLESISNQLLTIMQKDKNQEIMSAVSNLREQIDFNYQKQNDELSKCLSRDLQACKLSLPYICVLEQLFKSIVLIYPNVI